MINNETPVLRKEDLITILEALFRFSQDSNNALERRNDGLYVTDHSSHVNNNSIHVTSTQKDLLNLLSIDNNNLIFNTKQIFDSISENNDNALTLESDGLYVKDLNDTLTNHINDTSVHFTQQQLDDINNIFQDTRDLINDFIATFTVNTWELVNILPEVTPNTNTLYILQTTEGSTTYYDLYIYSNLTEEFINLTNASDILNQLHTHSNKAILDKFSEDLNGKPLYDNNDLATYNISSDSTNALRYLNGELYVENLKPLIISNSNSGNSYLTKTILYNDLMNDINEYALNDDINNYNFLILNYFLYQEEEDEETHEIEVIRQDAKTEILDVNNLNFLYTNNIDYLLEHDNALSIYNTKIRFNNDKAYVTYYHDVCIYQILGVN